MIKTALILAALFISAPSALHAAFALDSFTAEDVNNAAQAPAARSPEAPVANPKEWTIMVFMNGKSNIEPFALGDINRFETVGSGEQVNIVAELGRSRGLEGDTAADGDWAGVRRYFIVKDSDTEHIASPALMDLGDADMGDYKEVVSFVKWAKAKYPARRYMLIIWDHGWGWIDPKKPGTYVADRPRADKSISHDFVTGNYIKTTDLGRIFAEAGRVDLYVSMACFMQMAEVAYELRNAADVIVGSEEVIQLPSLNFEDFLAFMLTEPGATAAAAGVRMVETFKEMYSRPEYAEMLARTKYGVQLSAISSAELPAFAGKAANWARMAMKVNDKAALIKAKTKVLRFEVGDETTDPDKQISFYGDLYHFVELVNANLDTALPGAPELKAAGEDLQKFIGSELMLKNSFVGKDRTGKAYSDTHGIAIHIPGRPGNLIEYYPSYSALAFEKAAGWQEFISYLEKIGY
jgi:hypothetical protein